MTSERCGVKTVLITGAAARLGAKLVETFAKDGWKVFCHYDRSREAALLLEYNLRDAGYDVTALHANISSDGGCVELITKLEAITDRLDCLINNASAFEPDSASDFNTGSANLQLQVNLMAPLILSRLMAKRLISEQSSEPGCIIHILDQKVFNLNPDYFTYTVSKLALERSVALQARALAPGLRVCGVAPGLMYLSGPQTSENFEKASRTNLLRRAIDPSDVCKTCLFLATMPAITGSTVTVDNGQHLVPLERDVMFVMDDLLKGKI
jgi:NAD(P)-dependent dehydrogenase (short-subunit alcohol dehydrogenase family)